MSDISVIIPTYQHGKTIVKCVKSLLSQTLPPKEIIIIDDGSTDDTKYQIDQFGSRVKYVFQENQGAQQARNNGAKLSTGNFLLFCDADVVAKPNMLEVMNKILVDNKNVAFVYCGFLWNGKKFSVQPFDPDKLRKINFIHTTSLLRKECFPGFDPNIKRLQDWDLWLTILENGFGGIEIDKILFSVENVRGRKNISKWMPSILYHIPWNMIGWKPKAIGEYETAERIVKEKHRL